MARLRSARRQNLGLPHRRRGAFETIDKFDADRLRREQITVWESFKQFALMPVAAVAPELLDESEGDMFLFEWGQPSEQAGRGFGIWIVRQFTILDTDDDYDRMEKLGCSITFPPAAGLEALGTGTIWGSDDAYSWIAEVERSAGMAALRHPASNIEIDQSLV